MGFMQNISAKLKGIIDSKGEQIGDGVDKAGDLIDDKTGGRFSDKVEAGGDKVKDVLDGLDGKDDDIS